MSVGSPQPVVVMMLWASSTVLGVGAPPRVGGARVVVASVVPPSVRPVVVMVMVTSSQLDTRAPGGAVRVVVPMWWGTILMHKVEHANHILWVAIHREPLSLRRWAFQLPLKMEKDLFQSAN